MDALANANDDLRAIGAEFAPSDPWARRDFTRRNAGAFYLCWNGIAIAFRSIDAVPVFMAWLRVTGNGTPSLHECYSALVRIPA